MAVKMGVSIAVVAYAVAMIMVVEGAASSPHAPAPAVDCSNLILNMADCLSFVSNGSTVAKPEGTCCTGLKTVLKADAECLCEAFKSSAQLGVVLNVTKATTLPQACKVSAPSASNCDLSISPSGAPAVSPAQSTPTSAAAAPDASAVTGQAPAPSPGSSGAAGAMCVSAGSLLVGLAVASFSWF